LPPQLRRLPAEMPLQWTHRWEAPGPSPPPTFYPRVASCVTRKTDKTAKMTTEICDVWRNLRESKGAGSRRDLPHPESHKPAPS